MTQLASFSTYVYTSHVLKFPYGNGGIKLKLNGFDMTGFPYGDANVTFVRKWPCTTWYIN